jgi:retinol dehydrogenase 12
VLFSNELARRAAAEGSGITSNSLHPGMIHTELNRHLVAQVRALGEWEFQAISFILDWVFSLSMDADMGALTQVCTFVRISCSCFNGEIFYSLFIFL